MAEQLEPGIYVGTRVISVIGGDKEAGTVVVKVSGEAPWLMMELMGPTSAISPERVKNLTRIDQPIDSK